MFIIALMNAFSVEKGNKWNAFIDSYLLDQFTYMHRYKNKGVR